MGFYFRKSVNLGGLRFNFSKSGVGVSTGFKGFRIGSGPRGNYIHMGRNGIYYKKTWGSSKNRKNERSNAQNSKKYNQNNYIVKSENEDLDEYNTEEICDSSSAELVEEIKSNYSKITLKWFSLLYAFNPRYPIMSYSYIKFYGDNGFEECIMLSKQGVGNALKEQIGILQSQNIIENEGFKENKLQDINIIINNTGKFKNEEINSDTNKFDNEVLNVYDDIEEDPILSEAIEIVIETGQASTSFIQRRFKVGYARARRIIEQMEEKGIISKYQGSKPRDILMTKERWMQLKNSKINKKENDKFVIKEDKEKLEKNIEEKIEEQIEIKDKKKNMFYKK